MMEPARLGAFVLSLVGMNAREAAGGTSCCDDLDYLRVTMA